MLKTSFILGIETSCDECSASVVELPFQLEKQTEGQVLSLATHSQIQLHRPYGGVVPEIASRNHLETINTMIALALKDAGLEFSQLDAVAVTNRPGLVGALLVGLAAAKAIAYALNVPLIPVNHLEGHALSLFLQSKTQAQKQTNTTAQSLQYPLLLTLVSGGHSQLYHIDRPPNAWSLDFFDSAKIGQSLDDAAGEAFDKTAKILGFPYPGGVEIERHAVGGNPRAFSFPRGLSKKRSSLDFSFSGLKTAFYQEVQALQLKNQLRSSLPDLCASIQEAIVDTLILKIRLAVEHKQSQSLALVGGVAANKRLREKLTALAQEFALPCDPLFPDLLYCTDNAAMIAVAGGFRLHQGHFLSGEGLLRLNAMAYLESKKEAKKNNLKKLGF